LRREDKAGARVGLARAPFIRQYDASELNLRSQLQSSSIIGSRYLAEISIARIRIDGIELGVIESIEGFKS
jgi:hypothetical protein